MVKENIDHIFSPIKGLKEHFILNHLYSHSELHNF